ncbi:MAG: hypothetical protein NCW75_10125 [Phycisphaera sp.]|nr:MAG: hypothetical protein NCW75_10125 [Phycisphaera sp.]
MRTNLTSRPAAALIGLNLLLGSATPPAAAQDTRSALCQAGAYVEAILVPPTPVAELVRDGRYLLAPGEDWRVIDASDPTDLRLVANLDLPWPYKGASVVGQTAWSYHDRLVVSIDLTDPTSPAEIAEHRTTARITNLAQAAPSGSTAAAVLAVASDQQRVELYDATDPTALPLLGDVELPGAFLLAAAGDLLHVLTTDGVLEILNIADPTGPRPLASLPFGAQARTIEVHGTTVYIGCDDPGLLVVDASDPTSPEIVGTLDAPDCRSIVRRGGTLLIESAEPGQLPDGRRALRVLDAGDPADLRTLRAYTSAGSGGPVLIGQYAVLTGRGLATLDLSDSGVGSERSIATTTRGPVARTLVASGSYLYASVTGDPPGILVVDATDPAAAEFVRDIPMDDAAGAMAADDDTLALGLPDRLELWSLADRANPVLASSLMTGDEVTAFAIDGDRLYAAVRCTGRIAILDIADPAAPRVLGQVIDPGCPEVMAASGDLLAMHTRTDREIVVFDVSNPATPIELARYPTAAVAGGMVLSGDLLYAVVQLQIDVIDLSDPTAPVVIGQSEMLTANDHLLSRRGDVLISHDRLDRRLQFWSIADPAQPVYAGAIHQPNTVGVAWIGDGAGGGEGDTFALLETTFHETVRLHDFSPCVRCPADLGGDGRLNVFDFLEFINRFNRGDPSADYDDSGDANLNDYLRYQTLFDQGCL